MNKPIVFMFCGQGSQYYHMGRELFNKNPTFRNSMLEIDSMVFQYTGKSIVNEIYNPYKNINNKFDCVLYTHPAIFMLEYSLYQVLLEKEIVPDYLLGASLGEFTCTAVLGLMSLEDITECVVKQAMILEKYCSNGNMLAILNNPSLYYEAPQLFENSELTSVNYQSHFVISADDEKLSLITNFLIKKNIVYQILPISYGFHSSLIDPAEKVYKNFLKTKAYKRSAVSSFISCLVGGEMTEIYSDFYWDVVRKPIQFQRAIQSLESKHECIYLDLGPSGTLANFAKQNLGGDSIHRCYSIISPFNQEINYLKKFESLFQKQ